MLGTKFKFVEVKKIIESAYKSGDLDALTERAYLKWHTDTSFAVQMKLIKNNS